MDNFRKTLTNCMAKAFIAAITAISFTACTKEVYVGGDSQSDDSDPQLDGTLIVRTRASDDNVTADGEQPKVSYPVNIYVFAQNGTCSAVITIESDDEPTASISLPEGMYDVYAIAGADAESYDLPTQAEATPQSAVTAHGEHSDLMCASNTVTLVEGGENTLTLTLERKVMLIEEVTMNNIPSDVKAVSVTLAPLYADILLNGTYGEGRTSKEIALTQDGNNDTWRSVGDVYLLEATTENATITVNMTENDGGVTSYSYTSAGELKANYRIRITGTYTANSGVELSGTVVGTTWAGQRDITFDFSGENSTGGSDDGSGTDTPTISSDVPEVGTLYMDSYFVVRTEPNGNGTDVTLLAMAEADGLDVDGVDDGSALELVQAAIDELMDGNDGVTGWRLPTFSEITYIDDNFSTLQPLLMNLGLPFTSSTVDYYFFLTDDGDVSSFSFASRKQHDILGDWTIVRPVTVLHFE